MAKYSKNYNLEKQESNDYVSIEGLNSNFDIIDHEMKQVSIVVEQAVSEAVPIDHIQALNRGGTGATTVAGARTNLGLGEAAIREVDNTPTAGSKNIVESGGVKTALDGKANSSHTHDDRYYTETEVNTLLGGKANSSHTHTASQVTGLPTSLPANGGNSDTVDGSHAWQMQTLNDVGATHGTNAHVLTAQYINAEGRFRLKVPDHSVGVNYADQAWAASNVNGYWITTGTTDIGTGTPLASGQIYFVYE